MMPKLEGPKFIPCFDFIFCSNMFVSYHGYPYPNWAPRDPFCADTQRQVSDTTVGNKDYTIEVRSTAMQRKVEDAQ